MKIQRPLASLRGSSNSKGANRVNKDIGSGISDFFRHSGEGTAARAEDRNQGTAMFLALDDHSRVTLIHSILNTWQSGGELNEAMASGALRQAWDAEPYLGGARLGSYVTHAIAKLEDAASFHMGEFIFEWGQMLMSDAESKQLAAKSFPLTVYRGGIGSVDEVASGFSWTLSRKVASFYAHEWPRRWVLEGNPVIVSGLVDDNVPNAFFDDRDEAEIVIAYPDDVEDLSICQEGNNEIKSATGSQGN